METFSRGMTGREATRATVPLSPAASARPKSASSTPDLGFPDSISPGQNFRENALGWFYSQAILTIHVHGAP